MNYVFLHFYRLLAGCSALLLIRCTITRTMAKYLPLFVAFLSTCALAYKVEACQGSGMVSQDGAFKQHQGQTVYRVDNKSHLSSEGIRVVSWRWNELGIYFTLTAFIIITGLAKVGKSSSLQISSPMSRRN